MPDKTISMQQCARVIEIRPFRGGWQCFEAPGVEPYWIGDSAKEDAIATQKRVRNLGAGKFEC